ncbi:MAG: GNAT family N-acetyltransferase [Acidimicrobiia bacterium]
MSDVTLRPARPDEAERLSELALRSKAHWGYDDAFLEACRAELTVHRDEITAGRVVVAEVAETVAGFSALVGTPPVAEVDFLFVEPAYIGHGVGTALFAALCGQASEAGFIRLRIESDPNALGFYEHHGATRIGDTPSASIPGRMNPVLELDLSRREA